MADLNLEVAAGQFLAVLGANGTGKTTLLRVLLGEQPLTAGTGWVAGAPIARGSARLGYVPQRIALGAAGAVRARDVVRMGLDGHRWGLPFAAGERRRRVDARVAELMDSVGARPFAGAPVGMLSGGEFQRVRVAAALASDPSVLLCDEPLAALDLRHQREIAKLIDRRRRTHGTAVLFVTHDVNVILRYVDLILYLAKGAFRLGTPDEVLLPFAVHGISELSFAGASFALLVGMNVVVGSMLGSLAAAAAIGHLGVRGDGDPGRGRTAGAVVAGHSGAIGPDESPDVTATVDIQRVTVRHHDCSPSTT